MAEVKKEVKSFFAFEWKKIILPLFLIILFAYQVYVFYSVANIMDNYTCKSADFIKEVSIYRSQNNSEMLNKTSMEFKPFADKFQEEMREAAGNKNIFYLSNKIDLFFPVPCEISYGEYCRHYIAKKSYDCIYAMNKNSLSSLFKIPEYKPITVTLLLTHFVILFIVGYLISAVILFILRNVRIKK